MGEKLGRRRTIWLAMSLVIIGASLQASAYHLAHLLVGRVITGVGTGIKTSTVPPYQAELCDRKSRGRLVSAEVLFVGVGIVAAYWFDFGMSYVGGPIAWRLPLAFQIVFAVLVVALVFGLPESPRWLYNHGQPDEAIDVLCRVHNKSPDDEYILAEKKAIIDAIEFDRRVERSQSFMSIFYADEVKTRRRVLLAWGMQFMNQIGGINLVVYYIPTVLVKSVGITPKLAQILGGCINTMFIVGSIGPTLALDRMGRRKTMMLGSFGLGLCMTFITALLSQAPEGDKSARASAFGAASVAFFFLYMLIFGGTANCVPWVYVAEIVPLAARTRGAAIGVSSNWLWNFTIVMITPVILERLKWKAYLIFVITNMLFVPLVYFFYPETSNIQLEDIDKIFTAGGNPVSVARDMAKQMKKQQHSDEEAGHEKVEVETVERAHS